MMKTPIEDAGRTALMLSLVAALVVAGAAVGVGGAAAADEPSEPPAAYYGEITIDGQPAPSGTTIEAEIDGEVRGSITTQQDGQYGGPDSDDRKLTVNGTSSDDGATVTFYVVHDDGSRTKADQTATWSSAAHEQVNLSFQTNDGGSSTPTPTPTPTPSGDDGSSDDGSSSDDSTGSSGGGTSGGGGGGVAPAPSPDMNVTNVSLSTTEIVQGGTVEVTVTIVNEGSADGSYELQVRANTLRVATETVDVAQGEEKRVTVPVRFAHAGDRKITVDDVVGGTVTIEELEPEGLPNGTVAADAQPVMDMDAGRNGTVVEFDENVTIDAIVFGNASNGTVTVADLEALPADVAETPGSLVRAMDIRVPAELEDEPATIRLSIDAVEIEDPDAVRLGRYHDDEWQVLEPTLVEESGSVVVYEFETPGFSTFAAFAQETEDPQVTDTPEETVDPTETPTATATGSGTATDDDTEEAGFGTLGYVAIGFIALIAALLAAAGARLYQQNRV